MNFRLFSCACLFFFGLTISSLSQVSSVPADAEKLFELAASKHKIEFRSLVITRGASEKLIETMIRNSKSTLRALSYALIPDGQGGDFHYDYNTSVLLYSYEENNLSIWLFNVNGINAYSKQKISEKEIAEAVANLRTSLGVGRIQLSRAPHLRGAELASADAGKKISLDASLKNITDILIPKSIAAAFDRTEHLIVVPVLGIGTVPYAMLKPFENDSYLIDKMSVTIAPSLFDIGQEFSGSSTKSFNSPLVVGNPYLPQDSKWIIPSLPGAKAESQAVAQMLKTKPLIGKEAIKKEIVSRVSGADLLYFASHGIADSNNPLTGGFLMLSADNFEDGWWTAKEIQDLRLRRTKLVVLSACQTGLGKVHDAGIIGLARAFQIAGVPRVVMSLWSVDDAATSELMQEFIRNLPTSHNSSEALRQAILKVKKTRTNPSEWASFTVFGTPR